jgi:uncharacterized protein (TIGR00162 family)
MFGGFMNKPYFQKIFEPKLENPIFVEGLLGLGNIGMIATSHLIEVTGAKVFAELYSPYFPDYVVVNKDGTCRPPRYMFYAAKTKKNDYIILTGDAHPPVEDSRAHYDLGDTILDFVEKYQIKLILTLGGVAASKSGNEVYIAATSDKLAQKHKEKGVLVYSDGKIMGATGLLLGLGKKRGIDGICLLGATTGFGAERGVALSVYKVLTKVIEKEIKQT